MILLVLACITIGTQSTEIIASLAGAYYWEFYNYGEDVSMKYQASKWKVNGILNSNQQYIYPCGWHWVFGGFPIGTIVERTLSPLPTHRLVHYGLQLAITDVWTLANDVNFVIDGRVFFSLKPADVLTRVAAQDTCGGIYSNTYLAVLGRFFHSGESLSFQIVTYASTNHAIFSFSYIKLIFIDRLSSDVVEESAVYNDPMWRYCSSGAYYDSMLSSCRPCDAACDECYGPTPADCLLCTGKSTYDMALGACVRCPANCYVCSGGQENQCATCEIGFFRYWDGTCRSACDPPYIQETLVFSICKTPCQPDNFMLPNGDCTASCESPFESRIEGEAKFCDSPCDNEAGEYVYWNKICNFVCPFYGRTQSGIYRCDACQPNYFMYPNSTCLPNCLPPYKQRSLGGSNFCDSPCEQTTPYYYDKEPKCRASCGYPYEVRDSLFCVLPLSQEQVATVTAITGAQSTQGSVSGAAGNSVSMISFSNPAAIFVQAFADMLKYLKYMNIKFPPKLQMSFDLNVDPPFKIIPETPEIVTDNVVKYTLPDKFEEDENLHSSFLINFWEQTVTLTIISVVVLSATLIEKLTKKYNRIQKLCSYAKSVLKWNFSLSLFTSYFGDIVLFTSMEARTATPKDFLSSFSFILCFFINFLAFLAFIKIIAIIKARWDLIKSQTQTSNSEEYFPELSSVFESYQTNSFAQQLFTVFFIARVYIFVSIVAYLYNLPMVQIILLILLNLAMIYYIITKRPLKSKLDFAQYILQEIVMLIAKSCVLVLAILDSINSDDTYLRGQIDDVIMGCNMAFSGIACCYLGIQLICSLYEMIKSFRKKPILEKKTLKVASQRAIQEQGSECIEQDSQVLYEGNVNDLPVDTQHAYNKMPDVVRSQESSFQNQMTVNYSENVITVEGKEKTVDNLITVEEKKVSKVSYLEQMAQNTDKINKMQAFRNAVYRGDKADFERIRTDRAKRNNIK